MMKKESKFRVEMKGLGVSLIDNEPKEVLFLSVYKLSFHIENVSLVRFKPHPLYSGPSSNPSGTSWTTWRWKRSMR
jgi:hypothetical protein